MLSEEQIAEIESMDTTGTGPGCPRGVTLGKKPRKYTPKKKRPLLGEHEEEEFNAESPLSHTALFWLALFLFLS